MSAFRVEVVEIDAIRPIENADRLEIAVVKGWEIVVGKGQYVPGSIAVYFPIDSVLTEAAENALFSVDSKIKLNRRRVRTTKIRGVYSQGLLGSLEDLSPLLGKADRSVGADVATALGVTRYEPPVRTAGLQPAGQKKKRPGNPNFARYTELENIKWWPNMFAWGEPVHITEKIHGTNFRAGWVKSDTTKWYNKVRKFFGLLPEYEFVYGSRNVQLGAEKKLFYSENVYLQTVDKYSLRELPKGVVVYGEIYGDGIQKGYSYGCARNERKLAVFDVTVDGKYQDQLMVDVLCAASQLPRVPQLYSGYMCDEALKLCTTGKSRLHPPTTIEGCVVRPLVEQDTLHGRKILKSINPAYLNKADADDEAVEYAH